MPFNRWRQDLAYVNWLFNPLHGLDAGGIYDLLSTGVATESGLYLNLGYWSEAVDIDAASEALAMLVGEAAGMQPGDTVLDCGFGFGDQDLLWARALGPARIIGLNITASQVALARERVAAAGLGERVDLRHGSATAMPIESASIDKVVALECAFHFRTRERFFKEAWRVLRPGGRLVTADIIPMPHARDLRTRVKQRFSWGLVASKFAIPARNAYPLPGYRSRLAGCGFGNVRLESIRDRVYAPLHDYLRGHPERLERLHPLARRLARRALRSEADSVYAGLDYVLASAMKPG
jgi:SAM-dependent methyltransferase